METRERTFILRFSLTVTVPDSLWDDPDFEEDDWLAEWERGIKPGLIRTVFQHVRSFPTWHAHTRNRGSSPQDEIEIVVEKTLVRNDRDTD